MALLSELVAHLAQEGVDSSSTLTLFARRLREAGRLTQAGRGRGAAQMTQLDAARLMIACLASDRPEWVIEAEAYYSGLVIDIADSGVSEFADFGAGFAPGDTLDVALAKFLDACVSGKYMDVYRRWKNQPAKVRARYPVAQSSLLVDRSDGYAYIEVRATRFEFWPRDRNGHGEGAPPRLRKHISAAFDEDVLFRVAGKVAGISEDL